MIRNRTAIIFILTHIYPIFIAAHLYFGDWCRRCQILVIVVPAFIISFLLYVLKETSKIALNDREKFSIQYLIYNLFFITCYCSICVFSVPEWVWDANYQVSGFLLITVIIYIFTYRVRK